MYVVNFVLKKSPVQIGFTFKAFKMANELCKRGCEAMGKVGEFVAEDDFGCIGKIDMTDVACVLINDIDKETHRMIQMETQRQKEIQAAQRIVKPAGSPIVMPAANA